MGFGRVIGQLACSVTNSLRVRFHCWLDRIQPTCLYSCSGLLKGVSQLNSSPFVVVADCKRHVQHRERDAVTKRPGPCNPQAPRSIDRRDILSHFNPLIYSGAYSTVVSGNAFGGEPLWLGRWPAFGMDSSIADDCQFPRERLALRNRARQVKDDDEDGLHSRVLHGVVTLSLRQGSTARISRQSI